jgi:Predicted glycosyltransferases
VNDARKVWVVVVTFRRKVLLVDCLRAVCHQTRKADHILVIDNASNDGTIEFLAECEDLEPSAFELVTLSDNIGGAGGFSKGMSLAVERGADWIWMMDDDAAPHPDALAELLAVADDPSCIYGSTAVNGVHTSWTTTMPGPPVLRTDLAAEVPAKARVESLPFLGFLVHRGLVERIGLPDAGFFIAADDIEYCLRARDAGAEIYIAGRSRIEHPRTQRRVLRILGREVAYLELPPWKRYYDTRNRLLIARRYHGLRLLTQAIPGTILRIGIALATGPRRLAQLAAGMAGLCDGLLGIKGIRHRWWRIPQ